MASARALAWVVENFDISVWRNKKGALAVSDELDETTDARQNHCHA